MQQRDAVLSRCEDPSGGGRQQFGSEQAILAARHELYVKARQRNPARWSGNTRDWSHIGVVTLNPEHDAVINMATSSQHTQQKAA